MLLDELKSQRLSSVEFVQDYIQLHFDEYTLNLYNPVSVRQGSDGITEKQTGFKDALCNLINRTVRDVSHTEGAKVELAFDSDASVIVGTSDNDYSGPEALMLWSRKSNGPILVI